MKCAAGIALTWGRSSASPVSTSPSCLLTTKVKSLRTTSDLLLFCSLINCLDGLLQSRTSILFVLTLHIFLLLHHRASRSCREMINDAANACTSLVLCLCCTFSSDAVSQKQTEGLVFSKTKNGTTGFFCHNEHVLGSSVVQLTAK